MSRGVKTFQGVDVKDEGTVQAVFSRFNVRDHDGDVTLPGAFTEGAPVRISAFGHASWGPSRRASSVPMLPVGKGVIRTTDTEAVLHGQFFLNTQAGRDTFEVVKQMGDLQEWSYGYDIPAGGAEHGEFEGQKARFLKRLEVPEVSPVLLGAGIGTRTIAVKARDGKLLDSELEEALSDAGRQRYGTATTYTYVVDHDPDERYVIYCVSPQNLDERYVQVGYTLNGDGTVTLDGADQDVEPETSYQPVTGKLLKQAIPFKSTATSDAAWDGPAMKARLKNDGSTAYYRAAFAWVDPEGDPETKAAYKFIHHMIDGDGNVGAASVTACVTGIGVLNGGRTGTTIPDSDRKGVYNHLAGHLKDAGVEPPELKTKALSFPDEFAHALGSVQALVYRAQDLGSLRAEKQQKEGRVLSGANRERLTALLASLGETSKELEQLLAESDPTKHATDLLVELARAELLCAAI